MSIAHAQHTVRQISGLAIRKDIHQFGCEVRITGGGGRVEHHAHRSGHFQILRERLRGKDQNVGPALDWPLVHGSPGKDFRVTADGASCGRDRVARIELETIGWRRLAGTHCQTPVTIQSISAALTREVERREPRPSQRPFMFFAPAVCAHHENAHGPPGHDGSVFGFEPLIEPLDLQAADWRSRFSAKIDAVKLDGHVMRPGPDHDAVQARVVLQCGERIEVALDEAVVPAADRKNGDMNTIQTGPCTERAPESVVGGVIERLLVHITAQSGGGEVGASQR